jgi:putative ATPase
MQYIEEHGYAPPPQYLRDPNTILNEERDQVPGYKYPHSFPGGWVAQRYLPEGVPGGWYKPKANGYEQRIIEFLKTRKTK